MDRIEEASRARPQAWFRAAGQGPGVVCLHANASSSAQWRGLMDTLAPSFRVLAPDLYGCGRSPEWPSDHRIRLDDEVALIAPVLAEAGDGLVLVGHSYGAAVALKAALGLGGRLRALALYEPTLFALVDAESPPPNDADGIKAAVMAAAAALDRGDPDDAARSFIDYWSGAGTWDAMPPDRQTAVGPSVAKVRRWAHALMQEPATASDFARLEVPVLLLRGSRTTASARGVSRILEAVLPRVQVETFEGLGHMGPVTHPAPVNAAIERFLRGLAR